MEYIQKTPNDLSKYVDKFHTSVKTEFELALTNIYHNEINKYSDMIEHIIQLPFVQAIVHENTRLKEDILKLQQTSDVDLNKKNEQGQVVLEIYDKPITQSYQNMDEVVVNSSSDESSDDEDNEIDDESSDDDEVVAIQPTFPSQPVLVIEEQSADEEEAEAEAEQSADEEEAEAEQSADEEEQSADEEEADEEDKDEEDEEEQSADEEEAEASADEEEAEQSADKEQSVDEEEADEEETEVIELEIDGTTYYCDGEDNGNIYADDNGEVGDIVGELKDGEAIFH